ncbi:ADP-ribosylglycohydrolase family protein [Lysobacter brunescens]|uniref:ADP-ribosylglycohydrolase family protein n=1 Tax=Lysobacter brunescens TaxID=262323 RepID=A0ABW2YHF0_9GAMM
MLPLSESRLSGALVGLLVGDALGVPYEFNPPERLPDASLFEYVPPPGFERSHPGVPPGTWSDDGAQALCLLVSLLDRGALDLDDFASRMARWYTHGYLAVDGHVFDIGITTAQALRAVLDGEPPEQAGPSGQYNNGNGALMRVMPLVLWHTGDDAALVRDARRQSLVTHGHLRSQLCCALYCLWARRTMQDVDAPWDDAVRTLRDLIADEPEAVEELEFSIRPDEPAIGEGSGYVVDALRSARWASEAPDFENAMRRAIKLGHDTDTTACIAGGIAGLRFGLEGIPQRWRDGLRGQDLLAPLHAGLLAHRATSGAR